MRTDAALQSEGGDHGARSSCLIGQLEYVACKLVKEVQTAPLSAMRPIPREKDYALGAGSCCELSGDDSQVEYRRWTSHSRAARRSARSTTRASSQAATVGNSELRVCESETSVNQLNSNSERS